MASPYIGEIRMFAGTFAPMNWAFCAGQIMPIAENDALYTLIGTTYGGDGQQTFGLPNLQGRVPIHQNTGPGLSPRVIGQTGGSESHTLTVSELPSHNHALLASTASGDSSTPQDNVLADGPGLAFIELNPNGQLAAQSIDIQGGSQPHDNMPPFLVVNYIIALYGIFPDRT
jgi:microcystin-dependent protein